MLLLFLEVLRSDWFLAQWTRVVFDKPGLDAVRVEKVLGVAGKRRHVIVLYVVNHAYHALGVVTFSWLELVLHDVSKHVRTCWLPASSGVVGPSISSYYVWCETDDNGGDGTALAESDVSYDEHEAHLPVYGVIRAIIFFGTISIVLVWPVYSVTVNQPTCMDHIKCTVSDKEGKALQVCSLQVLEVSHAEEKVNNVVASFNDGPHLQRDNSALMHL